MKKILTLLITLLMLSFTISIYSKLSNEELERQLEEQDKNSSTQEKVSNYSNDEDSKKTFSLNGYLFNSWAFSTALEKEKNVIADEESKLQLKFIQDINQASFFVAVDLYYHLLPSNEMEPVFPDDIDSQNSYEEIYDLQEKGISTSLREAYIKYSFKYIDFKLGRQIIKWGAADSPTAQLNPNSLVSLAENNAPFLKQTEDLLKAINGLKMNIYVGPIEIELIGIPIFTANQLPDPKSFWGYESDNTTVPYGNSTNSIDIPITDITIQNDFLTANLENMEAAARIGWKFLSSDMNLYYFYGFEDIATFHQKIIYSGQSNVSDPLNPIFIPSTAKIEIETEYPQKHSVGFSSRGTIDVINLGYRLDVNFQYKRQMLLEDKEVGDFVQTGTPTLPLIPGDITVSTKTINYNQISYNIGFKYNIPFHNIVINVDYYERRFVKLPKEDAFEETQEQEVQGFATLRLDDHFLRQTFFVRAQAIMDVYEQSYYIKPEVEYRPTANSQIFIGALIFLKDYEEPTNTRDLNLASYAKQDVIYIQGKYSF